MGDTGFIICSKGTKEIKGGGEVAEEGEEEEKGEKGEAEEEVVEPGRSRDREFESIKALTKKNKRRTRRRGEKFFFSLSQTFVPSSISAGANS